VPKIDSGASALAPLLDGSTAVERIPELVRHGLQQLIELEVAAVVGANSMSDQRNALPTATATGTGCSPPRWATSISCMAYSRLRLHQHPAHQPQSAAAACASAVGDRKPVALTS